jgi:hypothetical protein
LKNGRKSDNIFASGEFLEGRQDHENKTRVICCNFSSSINSANGTLDLVKDNGELTKVVEGNSVRIFEEQPDGKWLAKVHIYNVY